jgi:hypothetical protein
MEDETFIYLLELHNYYWICLILETRFAWYCTELNLLYNFLDIIKCEEVKDSCRKYILDLQQLKYLGSY